jgi:MFS family permease
MYTLFGPFTNNELTEALVNASVGDLYFVHERGSRMALTTLCLFGGAFLTPVIVGKMTSTLGWPWTHYFVAIFAGAMLPLIVFLVPETAYTRDSLLETDTNMTRYRNSTSLDALSPLNKDHGNDNDKPAHHQTTDSTTSVSSTSPPTAATTTSAILTASGLSPFNGRKDPTSFWKLLLRPFPLFLHPSIFWAMLTQGLLIGWTVLIGIVLAAIMIGPPLFFNEVETGYMYAGPVVGAILGFILSGIMSDPSARWLTKRNKGVYEPEFRLVLVIPQLIFGCAGLYGFGITANNTVKYGWFWPDFFFALVVMGMVLGAVASALYIVDAHREIAVEGFTCLLVFKNIFSFGLTYSGYGWLVKGGIKPVFMAIASVQVVVCVSTVALCELIPEGADISWSAGGLDERRANH